MNRSTSDGPSNFSSGNEVQTLALEPLPAGAYDWVTSSSIPIGNKASLMMNDFFGDPYCNIEFTGFVVTFDIGVSQFRDTNFEYSFDKNTFLLKDDTGKSYNLMKYGIGTCDHTVGVLEDSIGPGYGRRIFLAYGGQIPESVRYIYLTIKDIGGSGELVIRRTCEALFMCS